MSASKHFDRIAIIVTVCMLIVTILFMNGETLGIDIAVHDMGYENRLFDNTKVHSVDIVMNNWEDFLADAISEEYYAADVVIDGEAFKNIGIRAKGNSSLSTVSSSDSDRYSFKIEFDHYDSSKTYHGLDKLNLNNLIQDSTMMKDYLTYTMMNEFGVAAPLCSYVYITVNGEDWGLYLAVEGIEESFLQRNYGSDYGELYKPESNNMGNNRGAGEMPMFQEGERAGEMPMFQEGERAGEMPVFPEGERAGEMPMFQEGEGAGEMPMFPEGERAGEMPMFQEGEGTGEMPVFPEGEGTGETPMQNRNRGNGEMHGQQAQEAMGRGNGGMGSSDVKLQYAGEDVSAYENIWNNAKTDISAADQQRLLESLEKLSNSEDLDEIVDVNQVIRYFVVHNYVCNGDSYTGTMVHNYYLYEDDGQLSMIPWDYNLAFGTFQGNEAQTTVNTPIDSPVSGGSGEDRPMWNWILSEESYTERYHEYFQEFLDTVEIDAIICDAYELIRPYVEKDPTAFFTYDEFEKGVETLRLFCSLRSESISMQLSEGETVNDMNYVDASVLNLSDMGSTNRGGDFGGEWNEGFDKTMD